MQLTDVPRCQGVGQGRVNVSLFKIPKGYEAHEDPTNTNIDV